MKKKLGIVLLAVLAVVAAYTIIGQLNPAADIEVTSMNSLSDLEVDTQTAEQKTVGQNISVGNVAELSEVKSSHQAGKSEPTSEIDNPKLKKRSLEENIALVEKNYPSVLNRKGFTEHEAEVIVRCQIDEMKNPKKDKETAIEKAVKELGLDGMRKQLLDEAFDQYFIDEMVEFTTSDIAQCLSNRLRGISDCTKSVLDEYLRDLSLTLESDVFVLSQKVIDLTGASIKKSIDVCHEAPERAKYQFRLVFVECEPI